MNWIRLKHSIYAKDENGRILAEILFPETTPGAYCVERLYVAEDLLGQGVEDQLMSAAAEQVRTDGGTLSAAFPYARTWLAQNRN